MENKKNNKNESSTIYVRIDPTNKEQFNEKLNEIYHTKEHRKISSIIKTLIVNFNNQDTNQLREYIEQEKPLINLSNDIDIIRYKQSIQDNQQEIQRLNKIVNNKQEKIDSMEQESKSLKESHDKTITKLIDKHNDEIQSLKQSHQQDIQSLKESHQEQIDSIELSYEQKIQLLEKQIDDLKFFLEKQNKSMDHQSETIQTLNDKLTQTDKDKRTANSDYKHAMENLNKLHKDFNELQNENKKYSNIFIEFKNMSLINRILKRYPDNIKELSD